MQDRLKCTHFKQRRGDCGLLLDERVDFMRILEDFEEARRGDIATDDGPEGRRGDVAGLAGED